LMLSKRLALGASMQTPDRDGALGPRVVAQEK
jgi:hypothetical protein